MAKILPSPISLSGNFGDLNFLKRKDCLYVRRKRGTLKPAKLNESFRLNVERTQKINSTAVPINRIMEKYAGKLKEGNFWRSMQHRLRKCDNDLRETHLSNLARLDLNQHYSFESKVFYQINSLENLHDQVIIQMSLNIYPHQIVRHQNSCLFEVVLLLWNKTVQPRDQSIITNWMHIDEALSSCKFVFAKKHSEQYFLLAIRVVTGINHVNGDCLQDQAMMIIAGGQLG